MHVTANEGVPTHPHQILVTCPQRLGDVLLSTALIRSLKRAWPEAAIDVMVLRGTEGVLAGNPDIRTVLPQAQRQPLWRKLIEIGRLWRRYDVAIAALPTDRSRLYAWIAGRYRVGFLTEQKGEMRKARWLNRYMHFDDLDTHTVVMQAGLVQLLGIEPQLEVVPPQASSDELMQLAPILPTGRYAVLHPCPKFRYKMWHLNGWIELAEWLHGQGVHIAFSGSGDADELAYVRAIEDKLAFPTTNLAGRLTLAQNAAVLERAVLFVGPDTVATHLAAACGTPTLALFGPSNPVKWGPWPKNWHELRSPWSRTGSGCHGNVMLLQGMGSCVPCRLEGCERHVNSSSACLADMSATRVIAAARTLLEHVCR